jgi:hypothetical protein
MSLSSIPLMFSNLIGQILPGFVVLFLFAVTILGPREAVNNILRPDTQGHIFSIGPILISLALSQAIGMLLGQAWTSIFGRALRKFEKRVEREHIEKRLVVHNRTLKALKLAPLSLSAVDLPEAFVMYDHLHLSAPDQAARLLKVRAERRGCHVLALGAALLAVLNFCVTVQPLSPERIGWEVVLWCAAVASVLRSHRLSRMLTNGIATTWLSLASARRLPFQSPSAEPGADVDTPQQSHRSPTAST